MRASLSVGIEVEGLREGRERLLPLTEHSTQALDAHFSFSHCQAFQGEIILFCMWGNRLKVIVTCLMLNFFFLKASDGNKERGSGHR